MIRFPLCMVPVLLCLCLHATSAPACGPNSGELLFASKKRPGPALPRFAAGDLGVLLPSFANVYGFVAYRYLTNTPLSEMEQKTVLEIIRIRKGGEGSDGEPKARKTRADIERWSALIQPFWPKDKPFPAPGSFNRFLPVEISYEKALSAFPKHKAELDAADLTLWIQAMVAVFTGDYEKPGDPLPEEKLFLEAKPHSESLKKELAFLRANYYQVTGRHDSALKTYNEIAGDPGNPWAPVAAYRALIQGLLDNTGTPTEQEQRLSDFISKYKLPDSEMKPQLWLGFIRARANPRARISELAAKLSRPASSDPKELQQDLYDLLLLLPVRPETKWEELPTELEKWLYFQKLDDEPIWKAALNEWRKSHGMVWSMALLMRTQASQLPELTSADWDALKEAVHSAPRSFQETALYHWSRLQFAKAATTHETPELKPLEDFLHKAKLSTASSNLFAALALRAVSDSQAWVKYLPRTAEMVIWPSEWLEKKSDVTPCVDSDGALLLNELLPLTKLVWLSQNTQLPTLLRLRIARMAWARAAALNEPEIAQTLATELKGTDPLLRPLLEDYLAEADPARKRYIAATILLRAPGLAPYLPKKIRILKYDPDSILDMDRILTWSNYAENYWAPRSSDHYCGPAYWEPSYVGSGKLAPSPTPALNQAGSFPFLSKADIDQGKVEHERFQALEPGVVLLSGIVLAWEKNHTEPKWGPEALYQLVRAPKNNCLRGTPDNPSPLAFKLLKAKYPDSEWAKKAKVFY